MKRTLLLFTILIFMVAQVVAQQRTISGKVIGSDGTPISFATVQVKGTTTGTTTDENGNFSLSVPDTGILVFSSIGYTSQEIAIGTQSSYTVQLLPSTSSLNELVVTALGIERTDRSIGYSVQTIQPEQLENARSTNLVDALAGEAAGVRVNNQSGGLGGSSKIVIRGSSSLSGSSQPLFVVDGVPVTNNSFETATRENVDWGNGIGDLSPDDIASMTILKGPAATAQYGSLAKDGAVIITTKRGKKGQMEISINSSYRADDPLVLPDLQTQYAQGNFGLYNLRYTNGWGPKISEVQDQKFTDFMGRDVTLTAHPNNLKDFFVTGNTFINSIALSGGDDQSDYRVGFTSTNATGIVINQQQDRYNASVNVGHRFSDKLSSRVTFNYAKNAVNGRPAQSSNDPNILTSSIYSIPITVDVNELRKNYQDELGNQIFLSTDKDGNNPYWILNKNMNNSDVNRFFGSAQVDYKPIEWLTIHDNLGFDISNQKHHSFVRQGTAGDLQGSYEDFVQFMKRINNDFIITAQKDLTPDFNLKVMVGNNILDRSYSYTDITASNLIIDNFYRPNNAQTVSTEEYFQQQRLVSVYGEITGAYKNFAFLTLTGRNDFSSTLPKNNNSYFYPSISGSLVFSELIPENKILSFGNVRLSYAQVGSDTDPYSLQTLYSAPSTFFLQFSLPGVFPFLGQQGFRTPQVYPPANLKPQIAASFEVGTNLKFWDDRIGVDFTYYHTRTRDQILDIDVPRSTGYFSKTINAGAITNSGIEAVLDLNLIRPSRSDGFNWDLVANFSHNEQIVNSLAPGLDVYSIASGWSGLQVKAVVGKPFALYGSKWRRSPDGQYVINPANGLRLTDVDQYLGDVNPDYMLGISNRFSYKGVSLGFLVDIRQGGVFFSGTVADLRLNGMAKETEANRGAIFIDKGVVETGTDDNGKPVYAPNTTPVQSMQDFWGNYAATANTEGSVFDASYVKLRTVTLSYTFPEKYLPFHGVIKSLEVGFEGRNVWLIKSFVPHVDPELDFFGNGSAGDGVEFASFPTTRSMGVNLKIKF
jgi:TonB-linked SusC/RagA family outer membrane protein